MSSTARVIEEQSDVPELLMLLVLQDQLREMERTLQYGHQWVAVRGELAEVERRLEWVKRRMKS